MDMYTNNFGIVGTRTSGGNARTFTVVGPRDATTEAMVIRSPTNWMWLLGGTLAAACEALTFTRASRFEFVPAPSRYSLPAIRPLGSLSFAHALARLSQITVSMPHASVKAWFC